MEITYTCSDQDLFFPQTWEGRIRLIDPDSGEMEVLARGSSFHIFFGRYINGYYLCIPNINVGTDLSNPADLDWNQEHLKACFPGLSEIDIISITRALEAASSYITI